MLKMTNQYSLILSVKKYTMRKVRSEFDTLRITVIQNRQITSDLIRFPDWFKQCYLVNVIIFERIVIDKRDNWLRVVEMHSNVFLAPAKENGILPRAREIIRKNSRMPFTDYRECAIPEWFSSCVICATLPAYSLTFMMTMLVNKIFKCEVNLICVKNYGSQKKKFKEFHPVISCLLNFIFMRQSSLCCSSKFKVSLD